MIAKQLTQSTGKYGSRILKATGIVALTLFAVSCSNPFEPYKYDGKEHDYRERHAVTVESTIARNWIVFGRGQSQLSASDVRKLQYYFSDFVTAGHGHITARLAIDGVTPAIRKSRLAAVRQIARDQGIKSRELEIVLSPVVKTPKGKVDLELGYIRYVAGLPNCPDWSKDVDDNRANTTHSNFGCATQSNLGMMVVDPADLVKPRKSRAADGSAVDIRIRTVNVPRSHPAKGVGTVAAGAPVLPAAAGGGTAAATVEGPANQQPAAQATGATQ